MKNTLRVLFIILLTLIVLFTVSIVLLRNSEILFPNINTKYSTNFTIEKFNTIKEGMYKNQVDSLLGKPLLLGGFKPLYRFDSLPNNSCIQAMYSFEKNGFFLFAEFEWHGYTVYFNKDSIVTTKRKYLYYE